ncbi:MAG: hypothetical protein N2Z23_05945 [Pyrinomonadaceae bacterium]|nr:hypothetical protein [Pyrinomonadaceae bacterium]MCX7639966.1 hypothetical protein [Pyrinomonadaceae bacterium]MDW8304138.1 hypothetical protein [Acidobacteriota bacterium]
MEKKVCILLFLLLFGFSMSEAQTRDPFAKPAWAKPKTSSPSGSGRTVKSGPSPVAPPSIQQRIEYYRRLRENAVLNNQPIPKVTTVLTLDELVVTGIFKTPRGYAAIVEATPIKLSYTIYPGEKFFDGQLVAVEENRLVFRRVTKFTNGKFISSEETKPLRKYSLEQELAGTVPTETTAKTQSEEQTAGVNKEPKDQETKTTPEKIVSPLEEMLNKKPENLENTDKKSSSKKNKKP